LRQVRVEAAQQDVDHVVLFGSRWSVDDPQVAHWVEPEIDFIRAADRAGVPVLGLCFGGQILSVALGGTVGRTDHPEIGWLPVEVSNDGEADGIEHVCRHTSRFKAPGRVHFLPSLPKSSIGKILRRVLRDKAAEAS